LLTVFYQANQNAVIPSWIDGLDAALQVCQTLRQQRHPQLSLLEVGLLVLPVSFAGKALGQMALPSRKKMDGERRTLEKSVVAIGRAGKTDCDQRRIKGNTAK
jgi:hypothetical protein